ncbi:MAG: translation initiation factor IF-1 [Acidobacteriales bacterium]|nr:translation initiation factor IF-1 [Terriglobales bacterium]
MESGTGADKARPAVVAKVIELLPRSVYRLELEDRRQVLAHAAGRREVNFVRLRPGDNVRVVISPHDNTRGRITELLDKD